MNDLFARQNEAPFLQLQSAKNQLYREAEGWNNLALGLTIFSAVIFPVLALCIPQCQDWLAGLGGIVGLASGLGLKSFTERKRFKAAQMQEKADVQLFGIPWNKSLGETPPAEIEVTNAANNNKKKKPAYFLNWYSDYGQLSPNMAALRCQQENIYWDGSQRRAYFRLLSFIGAVIFLAGILLAFFLDMVPSQYFLAVLLPQSGLLIYIGKVAYLHHKTTDELELKFEQTKLISSKAEKSGDVTTETLRDIQDFIFKKRFQGVMTPEWFYEQYKKRKAMQEKISTAAKQINQ